jgi:hypothetical protein
MSGALTFTERRRRDGTDARVLLVKLRGPLLEKAERAAHALRRREAADDLFGRDWRGGGNGHK